jgi:hypothetical protein
MRLRLAVMLLAVRLRLAPRQAARQIGRHPARYAAMAISLLLAAFIIAADSLPGPQPPPAGCTWEAAPQEITVLVCNQAGGIP